MINEMVEGVLRSTKLDPKRYEDDIRAALEKILDRAADTYKDRARTCELAAGELPEEGRLSAKYLEAKASVLRSVAFELSADIIPF